MKKDRLTRMTADQLVARFVDVGEGQDEALLQDEIGVFNRLFDQMIDVEEELRMRSGDQRRVLVPLLDHSNMQVRLNAAKGTLVVAPQRARRALQAIADSRHFPQAGDAGMSISNLDTGVFKPT